MKERFVARLASLLMIAFVLAACAVMPSIGCGECTNEQLNAKLSHNFPAGTPSARLVAELRREGFRVDLEHHSAVFGGGIYPACDYRTHVNWEESDGLLTDVSGLVEGACL